MTPRQVVREWVRCFNDADIDGLTGLYAEEAINHQVVMDPLHGRAAIRRMFEIEFGRAKMTCVIENLFEDGEWAILEWSDPNGLRGCGFFHVLDDRIVFQRGYFDQLSFFRRQGIEVPESYLASRPAT
jgi:limonene-1,2-epoxide hydrolase